MAITICHPVINIFFNYFDFFLEGNVFRNHAVFKICIYEENGILY
jgi:hypothetical protein